MPKRTPINITIDPKILQKIRELAKRKETPMSRLIENMLKRELHPSKLDQTKCWIIPEWTCHVITPKLDLTICRLCAETRLRMEELKRHERT